MIIFCTIPESIHVAVPFHHGQNIWKAGQGHMSTVDLAFYFQLSLYGMIIP